MGRLCLGALFFVYTSFCAAQTFLQVKISEPEFILTLPANPTTGFQWNVISYDKKLISLTKSQYRAPQTLRVGAGGQMVFTFRLQPGVQYPRSTDIVCRYARSWEPQTATQKTIKVYFKDH
ncbi:MAG: hypothetical protein BGO90_13030 [Legionella sp. 40-6]|nr:MAG: hypothetical protein BGO90_13030 [Legionella sp. 40-6]